MREQFILPESDDPREPYRDFQDAVWDAPGRDRDTITLPVRFQNFVRMVGVSQEIVEAQTPAPEPPACEESVYNVVSEYKALARADRLPGVPKKRPLCFDTDLDWARYRRLARYTAGKGFTYCADCLPARKREMQAQGRCKYPGVVFVAPPRSPYKNIVVGERRAHPRTN